MKLAEALQERADLNRHIEQLNNRLLNNAVVQEGEETAENPQELLAELDGCILNLEVLIANINLTNCATLVDGKSLTQLLAKKDCLNLKLRAYRAFSDQSSQLARRTSKTEIKIFSAVSVKEMQRMVDTMAKDFRILDNKIQELNWKTELQG